MRKFEKLRVWQDSIDFATEVYLFTSGFPKSELYSITQQLRRASQSIALNIAEGSGRTSDKEFCRFLDISIGSALECISAFHISKRLNFIDQEHFSTYYQRAEKICTQLYSLKRSLMGTTGR